MNHFLMSSLAADRIDGLRAEADRYRMARPAEPKQQTLREEGSRRPRRFHVGWLKRRAAA